MQDDFYLDTRNMDEVINDVQKLAKSTELIRENFARALETVTNNWSGKSRTEYDKKAHTIMQQVTDVSQSLYDIAETLLDASTAYMQADTELSKSIDGITNRY